MTRKSYLPPFLMLGLALLLTSLASGQEIPTFKEQTPRFPTTYFKHPIQLPVSMSGDFGEIRSNHFHSGLDLRTGGKEGIKVYAPADGYVSRINISAYGGGKVLYITHPNGYKTVYMHLSAFCGDIGKVVRRYQYEHQTFTMDINLPPDSLPVKQGQLVALTGNTGGSGGPHLHYEIRYAENDQPINPLYFGVPYSDPITPTIAGIKLYPAEPSTTLNGKHSSLQLDNQTDTVTVAGRFYTGIYAHDGMEKGSSSRNGVERIELHVDGELFHRYQVPTFLFEDTRGINAIIDYAQYRKSREYYVLSRQLRGTPGHYSTAYRDNGYLTFGDGEVHRLTYTVSDYKGNTARRTFYVRGKNAEPTNNALSNVLTGGATAAYFKSFVMQQHGFSLLMEPGTIYDNDIVTYSASPDGGGLSPLHRINLQRNPLPPHLPITVRLDIPESVPAALIAKLTVVCIEGKNLSACPTKRVGDQLEATSRTFGGFAVRLDTVTPVIKPVNFKPGQALRGATVKVKISDNLSGIVSYSCYVNGQWELAEHDGKTSTLTVDAACLRKGSNSVTFRATDAVGNTAEQTWKINK